MRDIDLLQSGTASAEQAQSFGRHVSECAECAGVAAERLSLRDAAIAFDAAFGEDCRNEHPGEDDLAALVDGSISSSLRTGLEQHLRLCSACASDVDDLRAWVGRPKRSRIWPAWVAAAAAAIAVLMFLNGRVGKPHEPSPAVAVKPSVPMMRTAPAAGTAPTAATRRPEWDALVADVRRSAVLPLPDDIRELGTSDSYRGDADVSVRGDVSPSATAIDEERPQFRWPALDGARYTVLVTGDEGREIAHSPALSAPRWTCNVALRPGKTYRWQVTAMVGERTVVLPEPPEPPAIFRVLSSAEQAEIAAVRAEAAGDHLLIALTYARFGEIEKTRRELITYATESRDPLANRLLAQLPASR